MLTQATLNGGLCLSSLLLTPQTSSICQTAINMVLHRPDYAISILE